MKWLVAFAVVMGAWATIRGDVPQVIFFMTLAILSRMDEKP